MILEGGLWKLQGSVNDMWDKMPHEIRGRDFGRTRGFGHRDKKSWWWRGSVQRKVRIKRQYFKDWCICSNVETWEN